MSEALMQPAVNPPVAVLCCAVLCLRSTRAPCTVPLLGRKAEGALRHSRTLLLMKISRGLQAEEQRDCVQMPPWPGSAGWLLPGAWLLPGLSGFFTVQRISPKWEICTILPPPSAQGGWKTVRAVGGGQLQAKCFLNTGQLDTNAQPLRQHAQNQCWVWWLRPL